MKQNPPLPQPITEAAIGQAVVRAAGEVQIQRDLYQVMRYVEARSICLTRRGNNIPLTDARRLAKQLSASGELVRVEQHRRGHWSEFVLDLARVMDLVKFDIEGAYVGYSSAEPSFINNQVTLLAEAWSAHLSAAAATKEKAILDGLIESTHNEFFHQATLIAGRGFDGWGCGTGPASRMNLPHIRRVLLERLAELQPGVWYSFNDVVDWLAQRARYLILDPATRRPDPRSEQALTHWDWERRYGPGRKRGSAKPKPKPKVELEDIYSNFREMVADDRPHRGTVSTDLDSDTPNVFRRVEGRYLEFFLRQIPYICGFVDLAYRPDADPHGAEVSPPLERLLGFRLRHRFFQVVQGDPQLNETKVTVLPNFEIIVEAPSYPDSVLAKLEPYTRLEREEHPIHQLKLEKKRIIETAAQRPELPTVVDALGEVAGQALPPNVAAELSAWSGRGEKVVVYEGCALVEMIDPSTQARPVADALGDLVVETAQPGWLVARQPGPTLERLQIAQQVPLAVKHSRAGFAKCPGRLAPPAKAKGTGARSRKGKSVSVAPPKTAKLQSLDVVAYRSANRRLLDALNKALQEEAAICALTQENLLVFSAAALPVFRSTLRQLANRFEVTISAETDN